MPTIIPRAIRANEDFRGDFKTVLSLPVAVLKSLVDAMEAAPRVDHEDIDADEIAERHAVGVAGIETAAAVLQHLALWNGGADTNCDFESEVRDIAADIGMSVEHGKRWPTLARILERGTTYQREVEARFAFHFEPAFEDSSFEVMLRPRFEGSSELVAGFHWVIRYHERLGESRAFAFELSEADVEELHEEAGLALEQLARLRESGPLTISKEREASSERE